MNKPITRPQLPPRDGYVEVEINGERQYRPTAETLEKLAAQAQMQELETVQDAMMEGL